MLFAITITVLGAALLGRGCNLGQRTAGVSWFGIVHEMHGTSKKARGRMQQRKHSR